VTWLLLVLAVFWAWETVLAVIPDQLPPALHPFLVAGLAYGAVAVPHPILVATSIAGAVGILHTMLSLAGLSTPKVIDAIRLPRRQSPPVGRGVGSRIPNLP
jgi:hypothetical protein